MFLLYLRQSRALSNLAPLCRLIACRFAFVQIDFCLNKPMLMRAMRMSD
jgi:hypothetical protein